jgi:predicted neuraminidase
MSLLIKVITVKLFVIGFVFVQTGLSQDFSFSGSVINFAGEPIPGAAVRLKKTGKATTTANDGSFTLSNKSTTINQIPSRIGQPDFAVLSKGYLEIRVFESAPVSITVFSMGGKTLYHKKTLFNAGIHSVSIPVTGLGVYLLRVRNGGKYVTFKTCSFEAGILGRALVVKDYSTGPFLARRSASTGFKDILIVSDTGYLDYQTPIFRTDASDLVIRMAKNDFPKVTKGSVFTKKPTNMTHSSTLLELEDGTLLCAFYGASSEGARDAKEWVCRKPPGGEWSPPISIADGNLPGKNWTVGNPVLFQPHGGDVTLYYRVIKGTFFLGRYKISNDGGLTWGEIKDLGDDKNIGPIKNKPIQLEDGTIIAGSSTENNKNGKKGWRAHIERSADGGKTWEFLGPIPPDNIDAIQPTLMVYPPGNRIQMMCRTYHGHDFIAEAWSEDGGKTWSELKRSVLPNNNSGIDAVTLHDGRQLLVYNHTTRNQSGMGSKARGFLNISLSSNGKDWSAALILEHTSTGRYSYPAVIQSRNGLVHVAYTHSRNIIKHSVINPALLTETVSMPDGKWPEDGPLSLKEYKGSE